MKIGENSMNTRVLIRGGGDIASGIACILHISGFDVLMLEIDKPLMVRRTVSFAQAVYDNITEIEGIQAKKVNCIEEIFDSWNNSIIPVMVDENCSILNQLCFPILIDAIMAKKNMGTYKEMASITIGVGPGFEAGKDVSAVIETQRGHELGRLIFNGHAKANTGIPSAIDGYDNERLLRAPCNGNIYTRASIGDVVKKGQIICEVSKEPVKAQIDGVLRGMIMNGLTVEKGLKIGDIDPRNIQDYCFTISDKARTVGGAALTAILALSSEKTVHIK